MRYGRVWRVLLVFFSLLAPVSVHAQWGPFLEKLQQLSGPAMYHVTPISIRFGPYVPWQRMSMPERAFINGVVSRNDRAEGEAARCVASLRTLSHEPQERLFSERFVDRVRDLSASSTDIAPCRLTEDANLNPASGRGFLLRAGMAFGWDRLGSGIKALTGKLTAEYRFQLLKNEVGFETGIWPQLFFDGGIDPFLHLPIPAIFNVHPFTGCRSLMLRHTRIGWGFTFYHPFAGDAFADAYPESSNDWEAVETWVFGFDVPASADAFYSGWERDLFKCD